MAKYFLHTLGPNPNGELNILPTDAGRFWRELANTPFRGEVFGAILEKRTNQELHQWVGKGVTIEDVVVVLKEFQRGIYRNATNVKAHTN